MFFALSTVEVVLFFHTFLMAFTQQVLPQKQWVSYRVLTGIVLVTLFVAFLVFSNLGRLGNLMTGNQWQTGETLRIGQSISLTGIIVQNGDYISYTHTISVPTYGVVWLKSKTIDLNQYTGIVQVNGVVEKQVQDIVFVIEVTSVSGGVLTLPVVVQTWAVGQYNSAFGVYFPVSFTQKYALQWPSDGTFTVTPATTSQAFTFHAFTCSSKTPDTDCAQLLKTIPPTAEKKFTDSYGNTYYKLEWVRSWLVVNGSYYGYFVQDADEQVVRDFAAYLYSHHYKET
jgi:hypothetical protein